MGVVTRRGGCRRNDQIAVLGFFLLLSLAMTWPLVAILGRGVLGPPGDNLEYCYKLSWFWEAIFQRGVSPFFNPDVFHPVGYPLALHEMSLANVCLGVPALLMFGPTTTYNLLVLLSFVLSGFGTYLLLWHMTRRRVAALLAGVIYAFCTYRMGHLGAGHLNLLGTQWFPLFLLSLEQILRGKPRCWAVLAGVFFALSALSSWYYAPMIAVSAGLYLLARARPWKRRLLDRRVVTMLGLAAVTAGVLMAPSAAVTAQQWSKGEMQFSLPEADRYSASLDDWLVPNPMHPWWGRGAAAGFAAREDVPEFLIGLSWVGLLVASLALRKGRPRIARTYWVLLIASLVLGLGTTLHVGGQRVYLGVPDWLETAFTALMGVLANRLAFNPSPSYYELRVPGAIYVPLPSLFAYLYVPLFSAMRVWARFAMVATLALAVLAGIGLAHLMAWVRRTSAVKARVAGVVIVSLAILELWVAPFALGWTEVQPQPVDLWLAQQEDGAVALFPLWKAESGPGLYAAMMHGKPVVYGYGGFFPQWYRQVRPALWDFPSEGSLALLNEWGVRYVLVGADSYGDNWPEMERALMEVPSLQRVAAFREVATYHEGWFARQLSDFGRAFVVDTVYVYEMR